MYLITYVLTQHIQHHLGELWEKSISLHYDIANSIEEWVDETQKYDGEEYILINAFPISEEQAKKWDGNLKSM